MTAPTNANVARVAGDARRATTMATPASTVVASADGHGTKPTPQVSALLPPPMQV